MSNVIVFGTRSGKYDRRPSGNVRFAQPKVVCDFVVRNGPGYIYYQEACRYWAKALDEPPYFRRNGEEVEPPHGRTLSLASKDMAAFVACLLNSSLFYCFYSAFLDCEHINDSFVKLFPVPTDWSRIEWSALAEELRQSLADRATRRTIVTSQGHEIEYDELEASSSKGIIDIIDAALGDVYGLTPEQVDYVANYDIKYRKGSDDGEESEPAPKA